MTRYSREEIYQELMGNLAGTHKQMASQLLEENRILREGLEFYASGGHWMGLEDWDTISGEGENWLFPAYDEPPDIENMCEGVEVGAVARETLSKADEVGKEK